MKLGFVAEVVFTSRLMKTTEIKKAARRTNDQIRAAKALLRKLEPRLCETAITHLRSRCAKVPEYEWYDLGMDLLFGLDNIIQYRGKVFGIDVTTNPDAVWSKHRRMQARITVYQQLGLDGVAVVQPTEEFDSLTMAEKLYQSEYYAIIV